jgi:hypothetical protein
VAAVDAAAQNRACADADFNPENRSGWPVRSTLKIPPTRRISEPYCTATEKRGRYAFDEDAPFGLPFRPTAFYVQVTMFIPWRRQH